MSIEIPIGICEQDSDTIIKWLQERKQFEQNEEARLKADRAEADKKRIEDREKAEYERLKVKAFQNNW